MSELARGDRVLFRTMSPMLKRTYQAAWDSVAHQTRDIPYRMISIDDDRYTGTVLHSDPDFGRPFYHVQLDRLVFYGSSLDDGTPMVEGLQVVRESAGNLIKISSLHDDPQLKKPDFFTVRSLRRIFG